MKVIKIKLVVKHSRKIKDVHEQIAKALNIQIGEPINDFNKEYVVIESVEKEL